ncbi:plasmid mobilization relaxosome protein MobC [Planktothrix sp. FACHB-1355]|uniref:Plasmid mobilization relaxosome protein MobC n=1 Tax=Aerosakkonema funiforme FACHB-1375 TaxID=2949571 RepID=A0A926VP42_9CYAN|nr:MULTISPECIES: plasmid mobilization relaxosome protein MobC [Oscillatoriales]MBD2186432.1 plasmid mobilization relaxosome protein MobC [Aerosakkonema funiforme FACHB-1375]MBD3561851.1 plasmid mobilization relaxosome protein MobC [Planktothrix sp. FACHB-1355]
MKLKNNRHTKYKEILSKRFELRLTEAEYEQIETLAQEVNLTMSEFVRRTVARRAMPRPLAAFDLKAYQVLCQINTELRQAGNNLNQIAKACNTSVMLGEPVAVNRSLLQNVQQLLKENQTLIQTLAAQIAQSTQR